MGLAGGSKVHPDRDLVTVTMALSYMWTDVPQPLICVPGKEERGDCGPRGSLRTLQEVPLGVQTTVNTEQARRWVQENS